MFESVTNGPAFRGLSLRVPIQEMGDFPKESKKIERRGRDCTCYREECSGTWACIQEFRQKRKVRPMPPFEKVPMTPYAYQVVRAQRHQEH